MAAPVVQSASGQTGGNVSSASIAITGVTAGNTLALVMSFAPHSSGSAPTFTVSDSQGAGFTLGVLSSGADSSNFYEGVVIFYKLAAEAGTHTLSITPAVQTIDGLSMHVMELPPMASFDSSPATTLAATASTHTSNSYTPTASALVFAIFTDAGSEAAAGISDPPSGWTSQYAQQDGSTTAQFAPLQVSLKDGVTGAQSATWTWTTAHTSYSIICGFIPAVTASAAIGGTATATINGGDIVTGGKTITITLTGTTWIGA